MGIKVGSFNKSILPATTTNVITGLGFEPESLIIMMTGVVAGSENAPQGEDVLQCVGFSDGTNHRCVFGGSEDGQLTSDTNRYKDPDQVLALYDLADNLICEGTVAFDSDGFTITWTTNDANAYVIKYWASSLGCEVGTLVLSSGTGSITKSTTNVPKALMFLTGRSTTENSILSNNYTNLGFATGTANETALTSRDRSGRTSMDCERSFYNSRCIVCQDLAGTALDHAVEFTSFDSGPNGFTLNKVQSDAEIDVYYIAFYEGTWEAGSGTSPTSAGTKAFTTSFEPDALLVFGNHLNTVNSNATGGGPFLGMMDGTTQGAIVWSSRHAAGTSEVWEGTYNDAVYVSIAGNGGAEQVVADWDSFNATDFTLDFTTVDASARYFGWLAVKDEDVPVLGTQHKAGELVPYCLSPMGGGTVHPIGRNNRAEEHIKAL